MQNINRQLQKILDPNDNTHKVERFFHDKINLSTYLLGRAELYRYSLTNSFTGIAHPEILTLTNDVKVVLVLDRKHQFLIFIALGAIKSTPQ